MEAFSLVNMLCFVFAGSLKILLKYEKKLRPQHGKIKTREETLFFKFLSLEEQHFENKLKIWGYEADLKVR